MKTYQVQELVELACRVNEKNDNILHVEIRKGNHVVVWNHTNAEEMPLMYNNYATIITELTKMIRTTDGEIITTKRTKEHEG